jgi:hypothetical protein
MDAPVAFPTERDQILSRIMAELTSQCHVMNFKVGT